MTGWHHGCNGRELGQTLGDGEGQGGLGMLQSMGCKESDMTGRQNSNNNKHINNINNIHILENF